MRKLLIAMLLLWGALLGHGEGRAVIPTIDDAKLRALMPGANFTVPPRLFTPAFTALLKKGHPYLGITLLARGSAARGAQWLAIPEAQWAELILPIAPVSIYGSFRGMAGGVCPFCGKQFGDINGATDFTEQDFLTHPYRAKARCCGAIIYARDADMPADYPAKPNRVEHIPHLDGTRVDYAFYVPAGKDNERKSWFSSAGEVWRARMNILMNKVIPDLEARVFRENDAAAARQLTVILDRLAEVYPGLPLYDASFGHGFARGKDGVSYLTREEFLAVPRPQRFDKPFYWRSAYNYDKLNWGVSGWQDGVMQQVGDLAEVFDLLRDRPEFAAYSTEKYGNAGALATRIVERLLKPGALMCNAVANTRGNTTLAWMYGAVKLGAVLQDPYFFNEGLGILEMYVANGYFSDGLCEEAAFNYAAMMRPFINNIWMIDTFGGFDLHDRYPYLAAIERGDYPIRTLFNIESQHADEHAHFFTMSRPTPPAPDTLDYPAHERAQCYPEYGLTCLRAGTPGHRLETMLDYQSAVGHTHYGRLNLQLFYEGVNLLPDMGYGCVVADITKEPWSTIKYPFDLLPCPDPSDFWGAWFANWTTQAESHCTALIDGSGGKEGPATFRRYLGGAPLGDAAYGVQFVEADARGAFRPYPFKNDTGAGFADPPRGVEAYNRQLLTLTLPSGRALALDVFRLTGGRRHDVLWHIPAARAVTNMGAPETLREPTLDAYRKTYPLPGETYGRALKFITQPTKWAMPADGWRAEWTVRPSQFFPVTDEGKKKFEPWTKLLRDVTLTLWGGATGSKATGEIIAARAPWTANSNEGLPGLAVLGAKDVLDYIAEGRIAAERGLRSTFVHLLEPRNPAHPAVVTGMHVLAGEEASTGAGARITLDEGNGARVMTVLTTLDGGAMRAGDVELRGRLGVIDPEALALTLYDGTRLSDGKFGVTTQAIPPLELVGVDGDLTGNPSISVLIVKSAVPLPTDDTLVGQMLTVEHRCSDLHTTGYTIEQVAQVTEGYYRIALAGHPPFIQQKMHVRNLVAGKPGWIEADFQLYKGQSRGLYAGRTIRFLRSGFTTPLLGAPFSAYHGWNTDRLALKDLPTPAQVQVGDPFIVYTIQPGDRVIIPTHIAVTSPPTDATRLLSITANRPFALQLPGFTQAARIDPEGARTPLDLRNMPAGRYLAVLAP